MEDLFQNANPPGYHSLTPSITVRDAAAAIVFYQKAFGAKVRRSMQMPDGRIMHAEITLGDSALMLNDELPEWGAVSPLTLGNSPGALQLYVADVDAVFQRAIAAGAEVIHPLSNQFWGDRMGRLKDPFGHFWMVAARVEVVSDEEMERRGQEWLREAQSS